MCSKTCSSNADCQDGGIGKQVLAQESNCDGGFSCVQIQKLGEFCCQKLCVCSDDLSQGTVDELDDECGKFPLDADGNPRCNEMMDMTPDPTTSTTAATM